ncbi:MAG: ABC transporter permease [Blautia sp.]|jgi:ribose/xylose/arabinose/galactoside ABC-type transport system permease subunit
MKRILEKRETGVFLIILILCVAVSIYSPNFLTRNNLLNILVNNTPLAILAIGMTFVIITGGIDVSVASQMMFSAAALAYFVFQPAANGFLAIVLALACGCLTGMFNGALISVFDIPPLIITLGTNSMLRGTILIITNGKWTMNLPDWFISLGKPASGIPMTLVYTVILYAAASLVLKFTSFGRTVYAYGGNCEAAKRAGIHIKKTIFFTYTICGICSGFAGLLMLTILGNFQPSGSNGLEMSAIAAVVIGGTNILGGFGTLYGTALGVILMGMIENILVVAHVPTYYQKMVYGLIIIIAVSLDILRKRKAESRQQLIDVKE